ncbi:MAG: hypothetical protein HPY53_16830 [Brevinematales bacterium]|nr:hypothetical protein [Brevinematales bacterium]
MKKNYLLGLFAIVAFCSCSFSFSEEDLTVHPVEFEVPPNKYKDDTPDEFNNSIEPQTIWFDFTKDLEGIPDEEWGNIVVKFHIQEADDENYADNNLNQVFWAMINDVYFVIPRPVGYLDTYQIVPNIGQKTVTIKYYASDISGIYDIIGVVYYKGDVIGSKSSKAIVKIPDLNGVQRDVWGYITYTDPFGQVIDRDSQLWYIGGTNFYHVQNNFLKPDAAEMLYLLAKRYIKDYYVSWNKWFILRLNDMSLPWGGMFWIGYVSKSANLTINRVDVHGTPYTILYRMGFDLRIYAPHHWYHRHGINFDLGVVADNGNGGKDESKDIDDFLIRDAADYFNFDIIFEGDPPHYHLKYLNPRRTNPYYQTFPN